MSLKTKKLEERFMKKMYCLLTALVAFNAVALFANEEDKEQKETQEVAVEVTHAEESAE
jgi:hypothetical protein